MSTQTAAFDVTVITVVRNGVAHIGQTVRSVAAQRGVRVEYIVIDGGSTDGTVELLREQADSITAWISEPDRGIGDAMNKGIARAHGDWLLFLHADDRLAGAGVLAAALAHARDDVDFVACSLDYGGPAGARRRHSTGFQPWLNLKTTFLHQATLMRRSAFARLGSYDPSLRIEMDYEFFLRAMRAGLRAAVVPTIVLAHMGGAGLSARVDWPSVRERLAEERRIHARHATGFASRMGYAAWWLLYPSYRYFRARLTRASSGAA